MKIDNTRDAEHELPNDSRRVKLLKLFSKVATGMCILMYISYIPQIQSNFAGHPVNPIQPAVAALNATLWTGYGWLKTYKDWPIIISNVPGIIFGFLTLITVWIH